MKKNSKQILTKNKNEVNPSNHQPGNNSIPAVISVDSIITRSNFF